MFREDLLKLEGRFTKTGGKNLVNLPSSFSKSLNPLLEAY